VACGAISLGDGRAFSEVVAGATDVASRKTAVAGQAAPFPAWDAVRPLVAWAALAFAGGAIAMAVVLATWRRAATESRRGLGAFAVAVAAMLAVQPAAAAGIALVSDHRSVRAMGRFLAEHARPGDVVVHEGPIEGSGALEWYSGHRPVILDGRRSVLGFGATRDDARGRFWDVAQLREVWDAGRRVWVVTTREPSRALVAAMPGSRVALAGPTRWLYASPAVR
jgi:hypothetical protein